jgi:predicted deacetylase
MKSLVVSLHDVSPLTQSLCERIVLDLSELGVHQISLLIIPNHHGRAPVAESGAFQRWLRREVDAGHEPVLHGYFHQRQKQRADPWFSKITTEIYTAGEGEFFDLTFDLAKKFLCDGLTDLAFLPRKVTGFVAPAWLLGDAAEQAVRSLGFVYTTRIGCIRIFKPLVRKSDEAKRLRDFRAIEVKSRSLVWSTRASWRVVASLYWNRVLAIAKSSAPVLRVSIHPADVRHERVWRQIREIIGSARRGRECISYESLVRRMCR